MKQGKAPVDFVPNTKQANVEGSNDMVEQFGLEKQENLKLTDEQQALFDGFHYDKLDEESKRAAESPAKEALAAVESTPAAPAETPAETPAEESS